MIDHSEQILEIIQQSAESSVQSLHADGQILTVQLFHDALDCLIEFNIKTSMYYSNYNAGQFSPCYLQMKSISDELSIEQGVYVASKTFENFMYECRNGLHVAYGLRVSQFKYFFKFLGACAIIIPVQKLEDIQFKIKKTS